MRAIPMKLVIFIDGILLMKQLFSWPFFIMINCFLLYCFFIFHLLCSVFSVTELCEYVANVDISISRESIRAVGKIALQQYDVNAIVDRLLQFLEMEKDYVTAETLVSS